MHKMSQSKTDKVQELYNEFQDLVNRGMTIEQALAEFEYLHPITLSRLKKRIVENSVHNVDKKEEASA